MIRGWVGLMRLYQAKHINTIPKIILRRLGSMTPAKLAPITVAITLGIPNNINTLRSQCV